MSRPLESAFDSAFLRSWSRNSADLTGQRARETPQALPICHFVSFFPCNLSDCHSSILFVQLSFLQVDIDRSSFQALYENRSSSTFPPIEMASNRLELVTIASTGSSRTLGSAADGAAVAAHGDSLALLLDVLEELDGALELPAVDGLGGLAGVLEGHTQVGTAGAGRLGGNNLGGSVPNLFDAKKEQRSAFCIVADRSYSHLFSSPSPTMLSPPALFR